MELLHSLASNKLETTIAFLANNGPYFYVVLLQRDKMQNGRKKNISSIFARKYFSLHKLRGKGKRKHDIIIQCTFFSIYLACYSWCPLGKKGSICVCWGISINVNIDIYISFIAGVELSSSKWATSWNFKNVRKKAQGTLWKDNAAEDGILPKTMKWNFTSVNKNSSERQTLRFRLKYVNCKRFKAVVLSVLTIFLDRKLNNDTQSTTTL